MSTLDYWWAQKKVELSKFSRLELNLVAHGVMEKF